MRVILARLIWNFDLKLAEEVDDYDWIGEQANYILWNKVPLEVVLTPVER
ncbi:hypothetical protein IMZ48_35420 [Candidatus Bathyarchaeota archaeon]|nr:hypothetical protein [Candidatus Bathyarchaeota archaeon]